MTLTEYEQDVQRNLEGLQGVSTGICPGCEQCRDDYADGATMEEFQELWERGEVFDEGGFSWHGCDICGSSLGGNFEIWHYLDENNEICHEHHACVDCVQYLANGTLPDEG